MRFRLSSHWKAPKAVYTLYFIEFLFTVPLLALSGIAAPNLYRTKLWQEGSDHGWNSDPSDKVYAYANYQPYHEPKVWGQFNTNFLLVISVLAMFLLLTKVIMQVVHWFHPLISFVVHAVLVALFAVSIHYQTAPDHNPVLVQPGVKVDQLHGAPWYIVKSCSVSSTGTIKGYCEQAKSAFAVTVIMLGLFAINTVISLWSLFSKPPEKEVPEYSPEPPTPRLKQEQPWIPLSPTNYGPSVDSSMTPRTQAFHSLGGDSDYARSPGLHAASPGHQPYNPMEWSGRADLPLRNYHEDRIEEGHA